MFNLLLILFVYAASYFTLVNSFLLPYALHNNRMRCYLSSSSSSPNNFFNENDAVNNEIIDNYNEYQQLFNTEEYEVYDPSLQEDEILDEMRLAKLIENDRWQSTHFRDNQGSDWTGSYETYIPLRKYNDENKNILGFSKINSGTISTSINASAFTLEGVNININENYKSTNKVNANSNTINVIDLLEQCTKVKYLSTDFRIMAGNQIVANVFTLCNVTPTAPIRNPLNVTDYNNNFDFFPTKYISEIAVREGLIRTRVRYAYIKEKTDAIYDNENFHLSLAGFIVIRESLLSASPLDIQPLIDPKLGPDIYDPQHNGEPYVQLKFPGRMTLFFPRGLNTNNKQCTTMEFEGSKIRYQVDRKFSDLTGSINSLELTEVKVEDAEIYRGGF